MYKRESVSVCVTVSVSCSVCVCVRVCGCVCMYERSFLQGLVYHAGCMNSVPIISLYGTVCTALNSTDNDILTIWRIIRAKSLAKRVQVTRIRRGMMESLPKGLKSRYTIEKTTCNWY